MGNALDAFQSESYYESELAKLSGDLMKSDHIIEKLREALKMIKRDINNVQSFEPDDYGLNKVSEMITETLDKYGNSKC
tara:strand:- start:139 stop:375 length:237 start_codon:yes stop_codon:yes gene_type:complete